VGINRSFKNRPSKICNDPPERFLFVSIFSKFGKRPQKEGNPEGLGGRKNRKTELKFIIFQTGVTHTFSIEKARKAFGYDPVPIKKEDWDEIIQSYHLKKL
jgi:hypothetical protein